jgi:hypothetical protein
VGAPTTQLLRLGNNHIDKHTKKRYHEKLLRLCPVNSIPDVTMEINNTSDADDIYRAWTKFLISKTRDAHTFRLLLKDNTSYGFRRNLWGLKPYGVMVTMSFIIGNYLFWVIRIHSTNRFVFPDSCKFSTIMLLIILLFWILIVTKNWVKLPAFSYAERLFEAIDVIDG